MQETWDQRIRRAVELAGDHPQACTLLSFYAELLTAQKQLYDRLKTLPELAGELDRDLGAVTAETPRFLQAIVKHGSDPLAEAARRLLDADGDTLEALLVDYWSHPSDRAFFAKAILQPYAQWLAENGIRRANRDNTGPHRCPWCGGAPQVSVLDKADTIDGASRRLVCATCLTHWPCRRVVCVSCGEEDERRLAYFDSPSFAHLRVDACDTCKRYVKTVDRTRLGLAVSVVDEVAGAPLDLWARDRGYQKIELNLVGL